MYIIASIHSSPDRRKYKIDCLQVEPMWSSLLGCSSFSAFSLWLPTSCNSNSVVQWSPSAEILWFWGQILCLVLVLSFLFSSQITGMLKWLGWSQEDLSGINVQPVFALHSLLLLYFLFCSMWNKLSRKQKQVFSYFSFIIMWAGGMGMPNKSRDKAKTKIFMESDNLGLGRYKVRPSASQP